MAITNTAYVDDASLHLVNLLDGVLSKTIETFESFNVPLPSRRYWTMGEPAIDCAQLVVSFLQLYLVDRKSTRLNSSH